MPSTKPSAPRFHKPKFVLKRQRPEGENSSLSHKKSKRARVEDALAPKLKPSLKASATHASNPLQGERVKYTNIRAKTTLKSVASETEITKKSKAQPSSTSTPAALPPAFKVIVGSYEKLLYGIRGTVSLSTTAPGSLEYDLKPVFIFPAHVSSVKAVAASPGPNGGKWLATGSADEIIKVWDLRRGKEVGGLMHHNGSITHLVFADRSHLFSASEDGTLALFHARDWAVLRTFKGHKGRVNAVAVHPSCKLALSTGKDRTLRMWDLMRGKASASTKIYKEGEVLRWNAAGTMFALATGSTVDIYTVDMRIIHAITHSARIHDVLFSNYPGIASEILLVGAENKKVAVYSIPTQPSTSAENEEESDATAPKVFAEFIGHSNRVKAIATLRITLPTSMEQSRESATVLASTSSDGKVLVYDMHALFDSTSSSEQDAVPQLGPVAQYDSNGTRLTCLTIAEDMAPQKVEVEVNDRQDDEDSEDEESKLMGPSTGGEDGAGERKFALADSTADESYDD